MRLLTLLALLTLLTLTAQAQTTLTEGGLTVVIPDSLVEAYFQDLVDHPDTLYNQRYRPGDAYHQRIQKAIGTYDPNNTFDADRGRWLYTVRPFFWIVPREPSVQDFIKWRRER